jgi:hypothetical protein
MNLKEIFEKAEGKALTYEQFIALATEGKAKFVDLAEGGYVDKQKYTDDLAARDTRITTLDDTIKARDTDLASLRQQLQDAGSDADKLGELNTKFTELQKQYDKDTKSYQKQLRDQAYKHAVTDFANQQAFTSQAAKRDFITSMLGKNLQMENDVIIGASDFMTAYATENADAFKPAVPETPPTSTPKPHFVDSTNPPANNSGDNASPFNFNFVGVRPHN